MKKLVLKTVFIALILPVLYSCNPFNSEKKTEISEVTQNSDLQETQIISGNNYVFRYSMSVDPIPSAIDDEYADTVLFSVDKNSVDNFSFQDNYLSKVKALYEHQCFCPRTPEPLTKGSIKGKKIDSKTWRVDGNFDKIKFSVDFKLKN